MDVCPLVMDSLALCVVCSQWSRGAVHPPCSSCAIRGMFLFCLGLMTSSVVCCVHKVPRLGLRGNIVASHVITRFLFCCWHWLDPCHVTVESVDCTGRGHMTGSCCLLF
jgi:hypothetical protein